MKELQYLADRIGVSSAAIDDAIARLRESSLIDGINERVGRYPEFEGTRFSDVWDFRLYRVLLYCVCRLVRPRVVVETGVLQGFSSAYVLQALADNEFGRLVSIDLPSRDDALRHQGTGRLPASAAPGFAIPERLRGRHDLRIGDARTLLPEVLAEQKSIDMFVHDSDHSYDHMTFELGAAWSHLRAGGVLVCDNVEQNDAFEDFAREHGARTTYFTSRNDDTALWRQGLLIKP